MIAFLLDTKLGHLLLGIVCIALTAAGFYWRGHNKGWDSAVAHDKAVVNACMAANAKDTQAIVQLQAANARWANAAKANAAKVSQAEADMAATKANDARALAGAQAKLKRVIYASHPALVWGLTRVPASVAAAIRAGDSAGSASGVRQ